VTAYDLEVAPPSRVPQKVLYALLDDNTTIVCMDANGQVRDLYQDFDTLNGTFPYPPFHYSCRTLVDFTGPGIEPPDTLRSQRMLRERYQADPAKFEKQVARESRLKRPNVNSPFTSKVEKIAATPESTAAAKARLLRSEDDAARFLKDFERYADRTGGRLVDLKYHIKSEGSLARKIAAGVKNGQTIDEAVAAITDVNRYTYTFPTRQYARGQAEVRRLLKQRGYRLTKDKNYWLQGGQYRGQNTVWVKDGQAVEIQFHTPKSFRIARKIHVWYDDYRIIPEYTPEAIRLDKLMRAASSATRTPRGALGSQFGSQVDPYLWEKQAAKGRLNSFYERFFATQKSVGTGVTSAETGGAVRAGSSAQFAGMVRGSELVGGTEYWDKVFTFVDDSLGTQGRSLIERSMSHINSTYVVEKVPEGWVGFFRPADKTLSINIGRSARAAGEGESLSSWLARYIEAQDGWGRVGTPEYRQFETAWKAANPKPGAVVTRAASREVSETLVHEMTHALDDASGGAISARFQEDGLFAKVGELVKEDKNFWYAAESPQEAVSEVTRFYFMGSRRDAGFRLHKTGEEWRRAYPELARWVEDNVLAG
jgi:hypothetical protein